MRVRPGGAAVSLKVVALVDTGIPSRTACVLVNSARRRLFLLKA
ncbi:MAG: hypothetical protein U0326_05700 [Polyangiales bacterium]